MYQSIWNSNCARCLQILCIIICLGILPSKLLSNDITDSVISTAYAAQECNLGFTVLAIHLRSLAHHKPLSMTPCPRQWTRQDCGKRAPPNTHARKLGKNSKIIKEIAEFIHNRTIYYIQSLKYIP